MNRPRSLAPPVIALVVATVSYVAPVLLTVAGLTLLVIAAFCWCPVAGYAAAGVACIALEWSVRGAATVDSRSVRGIGPFGPDGP